MNTETKTSYLTAKDILLKAEVPAQTNTYKPVSHNQLVDLTMEGIEKAGFKLDQENYSSAIDGRIATGRYTISNVADSEMQLEIGWQNSYDKTLTLKFAIGARILICQNGCVHGDMGSFKKKHVGEIQSFAPQRITDYIKSAGETFQRMQTERDMLKRVELTKRTKAELIGRMIIEEGFIQFTQLNIINGELTHPTFDYGAADSAWELYNFTTYAMKEIHPRLWMPNHMKAHDFFVNKSGLLVTENIHSVPVDLQSF